MRKSRKPKKPPRIPMDYYIQIDSWKPEVGLSLDNGRFFYGPYWEHYGIEIDGRFLAPQTVRKLQVRGVSVSVGLSGDRRISELLAQSQKEIVSEKAHSVGMIMGLKKSSSPWTSLRAPYEQITPITIMLINKEVRFIRMRGDALLRGDARIDSWDMLRALDPDDDPGVEELPELRT